MLVLFGLMNHCSCMISLEYECNFDVFIAAHFTLYKSAYIHRKHGFPTCVFLYHNDYKYMLLCRFSYYYWYSIM